MKTVTRDVRYTPVYEIRVILVDQVVSTRMHRRSFLGALGALPFSPGISKVTRPTPALPVEEDSGLWWRYLQHAIKIGDPAFCTDRFLDMVVMRSNLKHTTDCEARRIIRAAFNGGYSRSDVPAEHRPSPNRG